MALANVVGYDMDLGVATIGDAFNIVLDADASSTAIVQCNFWNDDPSTGVAFFTTEYVPTTTTANIGSSATTR